MTAETQHRIALRLRLASGACSLPLHRVHHVAGFATLTGQPDMYFLGWLQFQGEHVPVFDLNQVVCEEPTPANFGSRIILVSAGEDRAVRFIGLLAANVTDTGASGDTDAPLLDLALYVPMLLSLLPPLPGKDVTP